MKNYYLNNFKQTRLRKNIKMKKQNSKLRPKWDQITSLNLYQNYFLNFSLNTFHTFSYLSEYLKPIFYFNLYEQAYIDFYINPQGEE